MDGSLAIRRLRLAGLAPRDHPDPHDLAARLADAARLRLADALATALARLPATGAVLRIRRLDVDITLGTVFDADQFAAVLARAIAAAVRHAEATGEAAGDPAGLIAYPSRAAYVAALVEALAAGRAAQAWWLRDADGLRFLPTSAAIRTALLAEPGDGLEALLSLAAAARSRVLATLSAPDTARVLAGFAAARNNAAATLSACIAATAEALLALPAGGGISPLALFLHAYAARPALGGPTLAQTARFWADVAAWDGGSGADAASWRATLERADFQAPRPHGPASAVAAQQAGQAAPNPASSRPLALAVQALPEATRGALAEALSRQGRHAAPSARTAADKIFTIFGGLLLLVPTLQADAMAKRAGTNADLIAWATLGLCAGRARFAAWLRDPLWHDLFGLDPGGSGMAVRLATIDESVWDSLAPLAPKLAAARDARFLLPPASFAGGRTARRMLARLARAASAGFARRLIGLRAPSAAFLWENLLGSGAVLTRGESGWDASLTRPPLDVLLSLSRLAEGTISLPATEIRLHRALQ